MKSFFKLIILIFILSGCSFDNKTGIWENTNKAKPNKIDIFKDFETVNLETKEFNTLIKPKKNFKVILEPIKKNLKWTDEFFEETNNLKNFSYNDLNELVFKSKKLTKYTSSKNILYDNQNIIFTDDKGNIIVYSVKYQKIMFKYNFYKNKLKKFKKKLNIITKKNKIFISDNLGYLYALDYLSQKLLWAKNYKLPFRSNLKIIGEKLILADINNTLYFIDKKNGNKLKAVPTEDTIIKNNFINSLSLNKDTLYYLNTYGSLYSINDKGNIKWFVNLNQSLDINPSNLFFSKPIIFYQDKLIISTNLYLYIIDSTSGSILSKIAITSIVRPIISGNNLFIITKNNLLVCINSKKGEIVYSVDISQDIADYLNTKKKSIYVNSLTIVNNDLFLLLNNSYFIKYNAAGTIKNIDKLSSRLNSYPIFINNTIMYLDYKNKLVINN